MGPALSPAIARAFIHYKIRSLLICTLAKDFQTFNISEPAQLAHLTIETLRDAGSAYPEATSDIRC